MDEDDLSRPIDFERTTRGMGWCWLAFSMFLACPWLVDRYRIIESGRPSPGLTVMEIIFGAFLAISARVLATGKSPLRSVVVLVASIAAITGIALGWCA